MIICNILVKKSVSTYVFKDDEGVLKVVPRNSYFPITKIPFALFTKIPLFALRSPISNIKAKGYSVSAFKC